MERELIMEHTVCMRAVNSPSFSLVSHLISRQVLVCLRRRAIPPQKKKLQEYDQKLMYLNDTDDFLLKVDWIS